jgi:amidophosphoribosyltransferase
MCGIVAIFNKTDDNSLLNKPYVSHDIYESLVHLQHRGQDAAGIMTCETRKTDLDKSELPFNKVYRSATHGLVDRLLLNNDINSLYGNYGIGHVRYATSGSAKSHEEIQPFYINYPYGIALAHNGNLCGQKNLKLHLKDDLNRHLNTFSDSEMLLNLIAEYLTDVKNETRFKDEDFFVLLCDVIKRLYETVKGAYSVVGFIVGKGIFAFRDPYGIRPLIYGKRSYIVDENNSLMNNNNDEHSYIFSSESTMFNSLNFKDATDVLPGELCFVDTKGKLYKKVIQNSGCAQCIFEYIYFARPDSKIDNISLYEARARLGESLADTWIEKYGKIEYIKPDIVVPVPFTSNTAAIFFARRLNIPYTEGLYKNPFIGRTFIMDENKKRVRSVQQKLSPQIEEIYDKRIILLDDSIVRGTTGKQVVSMLRLFGAKEIYFVTTCPPVISPCFYGINIPTKKELIASNLTIDEIRIFLGVEVLLYQNIENLKKSISAAESTKNTKQRHMNSLLTVAKDSKNSTNKIRGFCDACLSGVYPVPVKEELENIVL